MRVVHASWRTRVLADTIRRRRNHGMTSTADERTGALWKYDVTTLGDNYRITTMQAALGTSQLQRLDEVVAERSELADRYDACWRISLGLASLRVPRAGVARGTCTWLRSIPTRTVANVTWSSTHSAPREVEATLHYPAVHLLSLYRERGGVPVWRHEPRGCANGW